jgi:hypothetical protein
MYTMKPIVIAILGGAAMFFLFSCQPKKNDDITNTVNKSAAIESSVKVDHLDSLHDILITTHSVWKDNGLVKSFEYRDTVPSLGTHFTSVENEEGDSKQVLAKKEYEIYITVK